MGVFDDATGEVNSVYLFLFRFKASEFVGVQFPHDASSEFQEILKGHHWFGTKDAVSFSDDNFQELFPTWVELSGLDVNWLSNESVIICADMIEHEFLEMVLIQNVNLFIFEELLYLFTVVGNKSDQIEVVVDLVIVLLAKEPLQLFRIEIFHALFIRFRVVVEAYCLQNRFSCHQVFSLFVFRRKYVEDLFGG